MRKLKRKTWSGTIIKVGDFVRILDEPEDSINSHGRVEEIRDGFAWVTNLNMPFQGTFSYEMFRLNDLKKS